MMLRVRHGSPWRGPDHQLLLSFLEKYVVVDVSDAARLSHLLRGPSSSGGVMAVELDHVDGVPEGVEPTKE